MTENLIVQGRPPEILLVEDNEDDVELTKLGFRRSTLKLRLHHVANGEECLDFLRKQGKHVAAPTPDLILLDLNMPRMDGLEVMEEVERDEALKHLPILVLTSSKAEGDVLRSYKLRCRSYLVKPVNFEDFAKMIQSLCDYWFSLVVLPPHVRPKTSG